MYSCKLHIHFFVCVSLFDAETIRVLRFRVRLFGGGGLVAVCREARYAGRWWGFVSD